jgi:hypothetical protein
MQELGEENETKLSNYYYDINHDRMIKQVYQDNLDPLERMNGSSIINHV